MLVRLALDELDAVVDQVRVEVLDLLLAQLDFLEPRRDLVVVEDAFFEAFLDELLEFLDFGERDLDGQQSASASSCSGWTSGGSDLLRHGRAEVLRVPGSSSALARGC